MLLFGCAIKVPVGFDHISQNVSCILQLCAAVDCKRTCNLIGSDGAPFGKPLPNNVHGRPAYAYPLCMAIWILLPTELSLIEKAPIPELEGPMVRVGPVVRSPDDKVHVEARPHSKLVTPPLCRPAGPSRRRRTGRDPVRSEPHRAPPGGQGIARCPLPVAMHRTGLGRVPQLAALPLLCGGGYAELGGCAVTTPQPRWGVGTERTGTAMTRMTRIRVIQGPADSDPGAHGEPGPPIRKMLHHSERF